LIRALARQKTKEKIERRRARNAAPYQRFLAAPLFPSLPFVKWDAGPAYSKRGSPESGLPLCETALCDA